MAYRTLQIIHALFAEAQISEIRTNLSFLSMFLRFRIASARPPPPHPKVICSFLKPSLISISKVYLPLLQIVRWVVGTWLSLQVINSSTYYKSRTYNNIIIIRKHFKQECKRKLECLTIAKRFEEN